MNKNFETSLKMIEPIQEHLRVFETMADFSKHYQKRKEELNAQTIHLVNKKYYINGYRLTRCSIRAPDGETKNELKSQQS